MSFTESNTVEQMILDAPTSLGSGAGSSALREDPPAGWGGSLACNRQQGRFGSTSPVEVTLEKQADKTTRLTKPTAFLTVPASSSQISTPR